MQAFYFIDSSFAKINNPGIGDQFERLNFYSLAYYHLYFVNDDKSFIDKAEVYADSTIHLIENSGKTTLYWEQLSKGYLNKGDFLKEKGDFNQSYQWFFKAKQLGDKFGKPYDKSEFNARLASLNYIQKRYQIAARYYVSQYNDLKKCRQNIDVYMRTQGALDNAGICYANFKSPDSAAFYYAKAIDYVIANEAKYPKHKNFSAEAKAVIYLNFGNLYSDLFNYDKALEAYNKSTYLFKNFTDFPGGIRGSELALAGLYLKMSNYSGCNTILNKYKSEIDRLESDNDKPLWYELKIDYLYRTKQLAAVNNYLNEYNAIKVEFDKKFRNASSDNINQKFYDLQKEYELNLLKKENQLGTTYLIIALLFTLLLLLMLYQIWRNWNVSRKTNKSLELLNTQITEQNLNLQETLTALQRSQDENKRVMKVVAHDLRSPIGAIVSLAGLMLNDQKLQQEEQHLVGLIKESGNDSLKFIDELLNREVNVSELEKESVDLNGLLNYCVNLLQYKATEKQQKITLKSESIILNINREKIWRVVSNLLTNAVKFSPLHTSIDVNMDIKADSVIISVRDYGIGIPKEMKEKIFNITESTKRSGTQGEQSFGMGLVISKQIVEAHGGKLWFESNSKGTTFFVELPIS